MKPAAADRAARSAGRQPSMVVISLPSHSTVRVMQERTALPSISTVQHPQAPLSQETLVPVRPEGLPERVGQGVGGVDLAGSAPDLQLVASAVDPEAEVFSLFRYRDMQLHPLSPTDRSDCDTVPRRL